jgi:hypothetical protein
LWISSLPSGVLPALWRHQQTQQVQLVQRLERAARGDFDSSVDTPSSRGVSAPIDSRPARRADGTFWHRQQLG